MRYAIPHRVMLETRHMPPSEAEAHLHTYLEAHKYIAPDVFSVTGLAYALDVSEGVVSELCRQGFVEGAYKAKHKGRVRWHIPQAGVDELMLALEERSFMEMLDDAKKSR